jgi:hypothetical protein
MGLMVKTGVLVSSAGQFPPGRIAPARARPARSLRAALIPPSSQKCVLTYLRDSGTLPIEVRVMPKLTLFVSEELHEKLRWLSYKQHRSQQAILLEMVEKALAKVEVPKELPK